MPRFGQVPVNRKAGEFTHPRPSGLPWNCGYGTQSIHRSTAERRIRVIRDSCWKRRTKCHRRIDRTTATRLVYWRCASGSPTFRFLWKRPSQPTGKHGPPTSGTGRVQLSFRWTTSSGSRLSSCVWQGGGCAEEEVMVQRCPTKFFHMIPFSHWSVASNKLCNLLQII